MGLYRSDEIEQAYNLAVRRAKQRGPTGDFALQEAVGGAAFLNSMGYVVEGRPVPPKDPDAGFGNRLQDERQTVRRWAASAEGRQALAEEAEANRPRARLWQGKDRRWYFQTAAGETVSSADRRQLLESLVFGVRANTEITEEVKEFLDLNPDYPKDPFLYDQLLEALAMREEFLTSETLSRAWQELKPSISRRSREIAGSVIREIEAAGERQKYFDGLSYEEAEKAIHSVARARKNNLI